MITPQQFHDRHIGKAVDIDAFPMNQPFQCYDLWAKFMQEVLGVTQPVILSPSGYAKDIWYSFSELGLGKYFRKVRTPQDGDWVIWDNAPATPLSHVAMFRRFTINGGMVALQQNAPSPFVTQSVITANGVLGYLRPLIYDKETDMLTKRGLEIILRFRSRRAPTKDECARYVGKVSFDEMDKKVQGWASAKESIALAKAGKLNPVDHLPSAVRAVYKAPNAPEAIKLKPGLYEVA